jgi:DNA-binding NarL/FixJ family response regulator
MSAREVVQDLLDKAKADKAHPERIVALTEAVDAVATWQHSSSRFDHTLRGAQRKKQNDESIDRATRRWQNWTSAEMDILDSDLTAAEIAHRLGRSVRGVKRKLARMREAEAAERQREGETVG